MNRSEGIVNRAGEDGDTVREVVSVDSRPKTKSEAWPLGWNETKGRVECRKLSTLCSISPGTFAGYCVIVLETYHTSCLPVESMDFLTTNLHINEENWFLPNFYNFFVVRCRIHIITMHVLCEDKCVDTEVFANYTLIYFNNGAFMLVGGSACLWLQPGDEYSCVQISFQCFF